MDGTRITARTGFVFLLALAGCAIAPAASRRSHWSVDLTRYGYSGTPAEFAASNDFVALAVDVPDDGPKHPSAEGESSYRISLLIFGVGRGKLAATCGPWPGSGSLRLWSTAQGNFLIWLRNRVGAAKQPSAFRLFLVSPSCKKLKELDLDSPGTQSSWDILLSHSRRTLLLRLGRRGEGGDVQIRDADTLALRSQWTEPRSGSHEIIGLSDDALLGADPSGPNEFNPPRYIRPFGGKWHRLPVASACAFLSNSRLVSVKQPTVPSWDTGKSRVLVTGIDGTPILSSEVSGFQYWVAPSSGFEEAADGRHFGWIFEFMGAGWLWGNLDMGPEHHAIYVWSAPNPKPVAKIRLRHIYDSQMALPPDGNGVAWLDGSRLNFRRLRKR